MGELKKNSLKNQTFPSPNKNSSMPDSGSSQEDREDQIQSTQENDHSPSSPRSQSEPTHRQVSMSELHRAITEALDRIGRQYEQNEERDDLYFLEHEGVLLVVGARDVDGVPAMVQIQAIVLEDVECSAELTADLLRRNGRMAFSAWEIYDQPEGTVKVSLAHELSVQPLDAGLVERMVNWVLDSATAEVEALQATYGGKRPVVVAEVPLELAAMPMGAVTFAGRYPDYEPTQAMAAFFLVSGPSRPSYKELRDSFWLFDGGRHQLLVGCFTEPDGTPFVVVTGFSESDTASAERAMDLLEGERTALQQSAHSTEDFLPKNRIPEAVASGTLRQLRPSEVGPIPDSASEKPTKKNVPSLRFDGLYRAEGPSYHSYLRFYEDGTVLQVSTNGKPEQLPRWFAKTHTEVPRGNYAIKGQSISFSTASSEGTVACEGQILDDSLDLSSHSYIDDHEGRARYSLVQVDLQ